MSRLPMPAAMPAELAERLSDRDDSGWYDRVQELMEDPDWSRILSKRDRTDLITLIAEIYQERSDGLTRLDNMARKWAERIADEEGC